jgi:probable HAF family extracellular repeat protein
MGNARSVVQRYVLFVLLTLGFLLGVPLGAHAIVYSFTRIDVPGAYNTEAFGINNLGQIVGSYADSNSTGPHGFLARAGKFSVIDVPGAVDTVASGINNLGQIVGSYFLNGTRHGFVARPKK